MLVRALRYVGYNRIKLTAIDLIYDIRSTKSSQINFKNWCDARNIPVRLMPHFPVKIDTGAVVDLFQDTYDYIKNSPVKNHLFLMIQPATGLIPFLKDEALHSLKRGLPVTPNALKFLPPEKVKELGRKRPSFKIFLIALPVLLVHPFSLADF